MKILLILALLLPVNAWANDPNYDSATHIVTFPRVTIDNDTAYTNLQLLLSPNGTWQVLSFEPEPDANLTGEWKGYVTVDFDYGAGGLRPGVPLASCTVITYLDLTQAGSELTGRGTYTGTCIENRGIGNISGLVNGRNISFTISLENQDINFSGTIDNDNLTLDVLGPSIQHGVENNIPRRWLLSL